MSQALSSTAEILKDGMYIHGLQSVHETADPECVHEYSWISSQTQYSLWPQIFNSVFWKLELCLPIANVPGSLISSTVLQSLLMEDE